MLMNEISERLTYRLGMVGTGKPKYPAFISEISKCSFHAEYLHLYTLI
jgi:hypothetical protein